MYKSGSGCEFRQLLAEEPGEVHENLPPPYASKRAVTAVVASDGKE